MKYSNMPYPQDKSDRPNQISNTLQQICNDITDMVLYSESFDPLLLEMIDINEIICPIVFFLFRDFYYKNAPMNAYKEMSLFDEEYNNDSQQSRALGKAIKKALDQKRQDAKRLNQSRTQYYEETLTKKQGKKEVPIADIKMAENNSALVGQWKTIRDKAEVYHLRVIEEKAVETYSDSKTLTQNNQLYPIVKLITNGKIVDSKRISGKAILLTYQEFYETLVKWNEEPNSHLWLEKLIDFANMESQIMPSFLFALSKYMDSNNTELLAETLQLLYFHPNDFAAYTLLATRNQWIESCYGKGRNISLLSDILAIQNEVLPRCRSVIRFRNVENDEICSYFKENYNLFRLCADELWTDSKTWSASFIKKYRFVVSQLTESGYAEAQKIKGKGQQVSVPRSEDIDTNCAE